MAEIRDINFYKSVANEAITHGEFCDQDIMNDWKDHEGYLEATYGITEEDYNDIMNRRYNNGWVFVAERLPEYEVQVLLCSSYGTETGHYSKLNQCFFDDEGNEVKDVVIWLSIPKKPNCVN